LRRSLAELDDSTAAVRRLDLDRPTTALPSIAAIDGMVAGLDDVITRDIREVDAWQRAFAAAKSKKSAKLATANGYADTMRGYLSQYDTLRSETSDWIDQVDGPGVTTYDEAYQFLGDATSERQNIKDSIDGLDAPGPLAGPQSEISGVLAKAVQAMGDASSGVASYQFSYRYHDYKDTPGWQQFESASDEISSGYATAVANWEAAISDYVSSIEDRPLPKPPAI